MDATNESVHTSDDVDIGDIEAINRDFIVVKRGFVHVHYYYIPMNKVEGWDGHVVWLKITEEEVQRNYQRDVEPEPGTFFLKGYPYGETTPFTRAYFPEMPTIPAKSSKRLFDRPAALEATRVHKCILCNTAFRSEDELSSHIASGH